MRRITGCIAVWLMAAALAAAAGGSAYLDGKVGVAAAGELPKGLFAKASGYLPGDSISVTNPETGVAIDLLNLGSLSDGGEVILLISAEAAQRLQVDQSAGLRAKLGRRAGSYDKSASGAAILSRRAAPAAEKVPAESVPPDAMPEPAPVEYLGNHDPAPAEPPAVAAPSPQEVLLSVPPASGPEEEEEAPLEPVSGDAPLLAAEDAPIEADGVPGEEAVLESAAPDAAPSAAGGALAGGGPVPVEAAAQIEEVDGEPPPLPGIAENGVPEPAPAPFSAGEASADLEGEEVVDVEPEEAPASFPSGPSVAAAPAVLPPPPADADGEIVIPIEPDEVAPVPVREVPAFLPRAPLAPTAAPRQPAPARVEEEAFAPAVPVREEPREEAFRSPAVPAQAGGTVREEPREEAFRSPAAPAQAGGTVREEPCEEAFYSPVQERAFDPPRRADSPPPPLPAREAPYAGVTAEAGIVPESALRPGYYVQIATLADRKSIARVMEENGGFPIVLVPVDGGAGYRLLVGPLSIDEYGVVIEQFRARGFADAFARQVK